LENVHRRLYHYLTPEVGACAGMSVPELQQVCIGTIVPTSEQLNILSRRMHLPQFPLTRAA
jgi:hypothetical protein